MAEATQFAHTMSRLLNQLVQNEIRKMANTEVGTLPRIRSPGGLPTAHGGGLHYGDEFAISRGLAHPDCPPSAIRVLQRTTEPRL